MISFFTLIENWLAKTKLNMVQVTVDKGILAVVYFIYFTLHSTSTSIMVFIYYILRFLVKAKHSFV